LIIKGITILISGYCTEKKLSPPFEGGVAGPIFNNNTNADTGRGG
jgi:hypothetical protein